MTDTGPIDRTLFTNLLTRLEGREPEWLTAVRRDAFDRFESAGLPTTRREDWRFTNLAPLFAGTTLTLADGGHDAGAVRAALDRAAIDGLTANTLVFVNGGYEPSLSHPGTAPQGVTVTPLSGAPDKFADLLRRHLGAALDTEKYPFQALATAFMADGLFLRIAEGVTLAEPLHVIHVCTGHGAIVAPRGLVVLERGAAATVLETFVGIDDSPALTMPILEVQVADKARFDYLRFAREGAGALQFATTAVHQGAGSAVSALHVTLGGRLVRNDAFHTLNGEGGDTTVNGLYYLNGQQQTDNFTRVRHLAPGCTSRQIFKGILADRSHGVFDGRIYVAKAAQQTDAVQTNRNLLLSDDAVTNAKPQLEIFADDVKCTHAATTGQLADEQLFYLRSRGFDLRTATALLTYAFAGELIEEIALEPVRARLEKELMFLTA